MTDHYMKRLWELRNGFKSPEPKPPSKPLRHVSAKKAKEKAREKRALRGEDTEKEKWFKARRREMVGTCQCGCGRKSSKFEDDHFRSSICHIFPKALFESVKFHPLNWVERNFWADKDGGSCHTNMDNLSIELWPNMADWDDIKEKFHNLAPLLTDEERATKFYSHLEALVYKD